MTIPPASQGVEIPYTRLHPYTLRALIEEFVTRDGTDYGAQERSLAEKVAAVMRQLEHREAVVVYAPDLESANIMLRPAGARRQT